MVGATHTERQSSNKRASKAGAEDTSKEVFSDRLTTLRGLIDKQKSIGLALLVTVSGLLTPNDYLRLAPILWYRHLDDHATHIVAPVNGLIPCLMSNADHFLDMLPDHAMR